MKNCFFGKMYGVCVCELGIDEKIWNQTQGKPKKKK